MKEIIREALYLVQPDIEDIISAANKYHQHLSVQLLVDTLSKIEYCVYLELGMSEASCTRLLKKILPNRIGCVKPHTYILAQVELKYCSNCCEILPFEDFSKNSCRSTTGLNSLCRKCAVACRTKYQKEYQAGVRARKLLRSPAWADYSKIKEIYAKCPEGYHVDHIIPLKGELVSGLHVESNLQYLYAEDNIKKNNKFIV